MKKIKVLMFILIIVSSLLSFNVKMDSARIPVEGTAMSIKAGTGIMLTDLLTNTEANIIANNLKSGTYTISYKAIAYAVDGSVSGSYTITNNTLVNEVSTNLSNLLFNSGAAYTFTMLFTDGVDEVVITKKVIVEPTITTKDINLEINKITDMKDYVMTSYPLDAIIIESIDSDLEITNGSFIKGKVLGTNYNINISIVYQGVKYLLGSYPVGVYESIDSIPNTNVLCINQTLETSVLFNRDVISIINNTDSSILSISGTKVTGLKEGTTILTANLVGIGEKSIVITVKPVAVVKENRYVMKINEGLRLEDLLDIAIVDMMNNPAYSIKVVNNFVNKDNIELVSGSGYTKYNTGDTITDAKPMIIAKAYTQSDSIKLSINYAGNTLSIITLNFAVDLDYNLPNKSEINLKLNDSLTIDKIIKFSDDIIISHIYSSNNNIIEWNASNNTFKALKEGSVEFTIVLTDKATNSANTSVKINFIVGELKPKLISLATNTSMSSPYKLTATSSNKMFNLSTLFDNSVNYTLVKVVSGSLNIIKPVTTASLTSGNGYSNTVELINNGITYLDITVKDSNNVTGTTRVYLQVTGLNSNNSQQLPDTGVVKNDKLFISISLILLAIIINCNFNKKEL